ncbi:CHAT domain-containing protein [bacterium]|nr:CHAT domain-containing protein [bacterium]
MTGGEGDRLPAARDEVAWLARAFGGVVTLADPAVADPAAWPAGDILHVAAHARPHDDAPWQSAILLGRARLTAARVAALDLDARVAVLAGCETAGGRVLTGEGIQGLSAAFLSSGVPVVVATLWPVDDRTTHDFVRRFYRELAAGRTVSASARAARLAVARGVATTHPFAWAGYVVVGDGDVTVDLARRSDGTDRGRRLPIETLVVVGTIVAAVLALRRRRHD